MDELRIFTFFILLCSGGIRSPREREKAKGRGSIREYRDAVNVAILFYDDARKQN